RKPSRERAEKTRAAGAARRTLGEPMGNLRLAVCALGIATATACGGGAAQSPAPAAPPPPPPPPPPLVVPPADSNPFAGARFYVNPDYTAEAHPFMVVTK